MEKKQRYVVKVHNPMGTEMVINENLPIRFELNGTLFTIRINKKENGLKINKMGVGSMRGKVDRIQILPEAMYEFIIK